MNRGQVAVDPPTEAPSSTGSWTPCWCLRSWQNPQDQGQHTRPWPGSFCDCLKRFLIHMFKLLLLETPEVAVSWEHLYAFIMKAQDFWWQATCYKEPMGNQHLLARGISLRLRWDVAIFVFVLFHDVHVYSVRAFWGLLARGLSCSWHQEDWRLACLAMGTLMLEPDLPGSSLPVTSSKKVKVPRQVVCNGRLPRRFLV